VVLGKQIDNEELIRQVQRFSEERDDDQQPQRRDHSFTDWRQVGLGAQILADLGVRKMRVMSTPRKYHALSGFELEIVEYVS
jgi:3,4-dihydroxy 2-butanone 4-phosphate synthase/GTP cyclohydrolase II